MASVPSARATSTRPLTCLHVEVGEDEEEEGGSQKGQNHTTTFSVNLSDADGHVHQAEHGVFELDGVQTLLPVSHCRVDVEPAGRSQENCMRGSAVGVFFFVGAAKTSASIKTRKERRGVFGFPLTSRSERPATWSAQRWCSFWPPRLRPRILQRLKHPLWPDRSSCAEACQVF